MNYNSIIEQRIQKKRKILVEATDIPLIKLNSKLQGMTHKAVIQFVFIATLPIRITLKRALPSCTLVDEAFSTVQQWARGEIKMSLAKQKILNLHAYAKTIEDSSLIALFHAYAQGLSCVHTKKHAMGLPIYELTAIIHQNLYGDYEKILTQKVKEYLEIIDQIPEDLNDKTWAKFIH